jgi:hypothetical protein
VEYRKEGIRLFKEMQEVVLVRIAEVLPRLQPMIVEREEAEMKKQSEAAQAASGDSEAIASGNQPVTAKDVPSRNDMVTISDGKETQTLKYKKAEPLIANGSWKIISK